MIFEKGILTIKDTDGLELTYGNHQAMLTLIEKIANRKGLGDILAEGTVRASAYFGKEAKEFAMQVKGLEVIVLKKFLVHLFQDQLILLLMREKVILL